MGKGTAEERFWRNVVKSDGCWLWSGYVKPNGYGSFYPGGGRGVDKIYAHRFSYELAFGPLALGAEVDHLCNVRSCVNPSHLEAVSHRENLDRAKDRRTHCKFGHPFDASNTYMWRGNRYCRTCRLFRREQRAS